MFVCPTVSVLRFYGCCHPCSNTFQREIYPYTTTSTTPTPEPFMTSLFYRHYTELHISERKERSIRTPLHQLRLHQNPSSTLQQHLI